MQMVTNQYEYWGPLTGHNSPTLYGEFLEQAAYSLTLPRVLLATTGTILLNAAISYVESLGYNQLFLYTSGTLPNYYRKRGWTEIEDVTYLGKVRTIMRFDISSKR
jgi:hypothetical protein